MWYISLAGGRCRSKMKQENDMGPALIRAAIKFICLYVPLQVLYFHFGGYGNVGMMLMASVFLGTGEGAIFGWSERKREKVVPELASFGGLFVVVLILSALLFYTAPHQGTWETIFFYFPQLLVLVYVIPGAICLTVLMGIMMTRKDKKA